MKDHQLRTKKFYNIGPLKMRDSKYYFLSLSVRGRRYRTLDITIMSHLFYHCATTSGYCQYEVNNIFIFGAMTLGITTSSIMTFNLSGLYVTLSISDSIKDT